MPHFDYEAWIQVTEEGVPDGIAAPAAERGRGTVADPPADVLLMTCGEWKEAPTVGDRWLDEIEFRAHVAVLESAGVPHGLDEARW